MHFGTLRLIGSFQRCRHASEARIAILRRHAGYFRITDNAQARFPFSDQFSSSARFTDIGTLHRYGTLFTMACDRETSGA